MVLLIWNTSAHCLTLFSAFMVVLCVSFRKWGPEKVAYFSISKCADTISVAVVWEGKW